VDEIDASDGESLSSHEELRQLEARIDARFQAVNARFIAVDGRFVAVGDTVDDAMQAALDLFQKTDERLSRFDEAHDCERDRLEHIRTELSGVIEASRRDLARIVVLGLVGTVASTALLCIGILVLLL